MGNSCDNGWRCPFVGLDRMFGVFLRQKETSIPNDLTRMVSLRQSQTRRRIESNRIVFLNTHITRNRKESTRVTSVSSGGGAFRKTACYLYEQKLDNKKILKAAIEESKSRTGTARRSKKNKGEKGRMAHHFCNVYISRVAVFVSFFP